MHWSSCTERWKALVAVVELCASYQSPHASGPRQRPLVEMAGRARRSRTTQSQKRNRSRRAPGANKTGSTSRSEMTRASSSTFAAAGPLWYRAHGRSRITNGDCLGSVARYEAYERCARCWSSLVARYRNAIAWRSLYEKGQCEVRCARLGTQSVGATYRTKVQMCDRQHSR